MPETFGTAQRSWIVADGVSTSNANPLGAGNFAYSATRPTGTLASQGYGVLGTSSDALDVSNTIALMFYGATINSGTTAGEARARIWAVSPGNHLNFSPEGWLGTLLGDLTIKFGSTEIPTSDLFPGPPSGIPFRFANDILITNDRTLSPPAMRLVGQDGSAGACMLLLDSIGAASIIVQLTTKLAGGVAATMQSLGLGYRLL